MLCSRKTTAAKCPPPRRKSVTVALFIASSIAPEGERESERVSIKVQRKSINLCRVLCVTQVRPLKTAAAKWPPPTRKSVTVALFIANSIAPADTRCCIKGVLKCCVQGVFKCCVKGMTKCCS